MRILIVDDDVDLAEITSDLLRRIDFPEQYVESISLASDLETAIQLLPDHDAVLCDGMFPLSQHSPSTGERWGRVCREATRRGIHFVLYSGCSHALNEARDGGIPAVSKPASIKEIYAALVEAVIPRMAGKDQGRTGSLAEGSTWEAKYETNA